MLYFPFAKGNFEVIFLLLKTSVHAYNRKNVGTALFFRYGTSKTISHVGNACNTLTAKPTDNRYYQNDTIKRLINKKKIISVQYINFYIAWFLMPKKQNQFSHRKVTSACHSYPHCPSRLFFFFFFLQGPLFPFFNTFNQLIQRATKTLFLPKAKFSTLPNALFLLLHQKKSIFFFI